MVALTRCPRYTNYIPDIFEANPDLPALWSHLLALVLHPEASCEPYWNNEGLISLSHAHRVALRSHMSF